MKHIFQKISIVLLLTVFAFGAKSQGHKIEVEIDNYSDDLIYILHYYGKSNKVVDTVYRNNNGDFIYKGDEKLPGGIYMIATKNKNYFEILVDKDQEFKVHTTYPDFINQMKIKGSEDNVDFYKYLKLVTTNQPKIAELQKTKKDASEAEKKNIDEQIKSLQQEIEDFRDNLYAEKPESFLSVVLMASKEPENPEVLPLKEDGTPDSSYIYTHYINNYFKYMDLSDERLIRTPIYDRKIRQYFTKIIPQHPDTLIKRGDWMIEQTNGNKETFKYLVWYITYETETSQIMGFDKAFVHFASKYYLSGEAWWVNKKVLNNMRKRVEKLSNVLIGNKAKNMILIDTNNNWVPLYDVDASYTIIVFWDPDCGHCKKELPKIKEFVDDYKDEMGIKVYSVCADTNLRNWKKYIRKHNLNFINVNGTRSITPNYHDLYDIISTPTIFVLDKDKKILAKRINHIQMENIIKRDFKATKKEEE